MKEEGKEGKKVGRCDVGKKELETSGKGGVKGVLGSGFWQ